jgi:hypothetical protein
MAPPIGKIYTIRNPAKKVWFSNSLFVPFEIRTNLSGFQMALGI